MWTQRTWAALGAQAGSASGTEALVLNTDKKQHRAPQDRGREDHVPWLAADRVFSRNLIKLKSSQKFAFQGRLMNSF